ncbi:hypothetical protein Godav_000012 [Gossypium davidsonii]|uniref:Aminotransferase-like plant mobile domain-containing protein n=1 Tax=Gossypium davidsonii TaxID=34287 RepID=A0A7J8THP0_GOSDV|nr:hypothetical protein [Gossypium davidsonii]
MKTALHKEYDCSLDSTQGSMGLPWKTKGIWMATNGQWKPFLSHKGAWVEDQILEMYINNLSEDASEVIHELLRDASFLDAICMLGGTKLDLPLISVLVKRWRLETYTFNLPYDKCTITLKDTRRRLGNIPQEVYRVLAVQFRYHKKLYLLSALERSRQRRYRRPKQEPINPRLGEDVAEEPTYLPHAHEDPITVQPPDAFGIVDNVTITPNIVILPSWVVLAYADSIVGMQYRRLGHSHSHPRRKEMRSAINLDVHIKMRSKSQMSRQPQ